MAQMTFLQLQAAVMSDRFDEAQRGDVRNWINAAYWDTWSLEEWVFRYATADVNVTSGSTAVTGLPSDFGTVRNFQRGDGGVIEWLDPVEWQRRYYNPRSPSVGLPQHYTVTNGVVTVGPASTETASDYQLVYEKEFTTLVNDGDLHKLPPGSDFVLVFGAAVLGLQIQNDFTWQFIEQKRQALVDSLKRAYLANTRDKNQAYAGDVLGLIG
jgi:hypothetical protein